ncbi:MAG: histidine phosphatase family protein [Gemmatimonadota bacterium]|nr:histidine phosphatase family protein [Gemmatimonadota bacterium]
MHRVARSLLPLVALFTLATCAVAQERAVPTTVVVIVRHAEKAAEPAADPPLTAVGVERARALAALLADAKVSVVMHTPTTRTRETARPVAEQFGLSPIVLPLGPSEIHPAAVAEAIRQYPGRTIVVVGHSNTIMRYIEALGGPLRPNLCDHQYDGLYTLILDGTSVRLVEARYGPPNPPRTAPCATMTPGP